MEVKTQTFLRLGGFQDVQDLVNIYQEKSCNIVTNLVDQISA